MPACRPAPSPPGNAFVSCAGSASTPSPTATICSSRSAAAAFCSNFPTSATRKRCASSARAPSGASSPRGCKPELEYFPGRSRDARAPTIGAQGVHFHPPSRGGIMQNALVAPRTSSHDRTFPPFGRALAAAGVLATLAVALPRHDASRLVPCYRCSIVSEREASAASGATLTLSPSDGHACRYVGNAAQGALAL